MGHLLSPSAKAQPHDRLRQTHTKESLKSADGDWAKRYKLALYRIIEGPSYWKHPPKETPSGVRCSPFARASPSLSHSR